MVTLSCGHKVENGVPQNFVHRKTTHFDFSAKYYVRAVSSEVVCDECKKEMEELGLLLSEEEIPHWYSGKINDPEEWW